MELDRSGLGFRFRFSIKVETREWSVCRRTRTHELFVGMYVYVGITRWYLLEYRGGDQCTWSEARRIILCTVIRYSGSQLPISFSLCSLDGMPLR